MNILLTGATGFVGTCVTEQLKRSHSIVCIGRTDPQRSGVVFEYGDIADRAALETIATRYQEGYFDVIVHLAAYVPRIKEADILSEANAVNVQGIVNLLEVFDGKFKKLVIGSSAEVYDLSGSKGYLSENSPVLPQSYYGATKLGGEFIALTYGKKAGIPVAVLRFSVMYGNNDPIARALPNFIHKAIKDEPIEVYGGDVLRDYVHIDDVVASIECALVADFPSQVFNIGTGRGVSIRSAATAIVKTSKSNSPIIDRSGTGLDVVLNIERAQKVLKFEPKVFFPDKLQEMIASYQK